jgi:hypothetical protein
MKCYSHPERNAIARIQGVTDSFGCECTIVASGVRGDAGRKIRKTGG